MTEEGGTDTIEATGVLGLVPFTCTASKSWTAMGLDYGDAPDWLEEAEVAYPTLQENDGPRHVIPDGGAELFMGGAPDVDLNGQPEPRALGDDQDGNDDEDGVSLPSTLLVGQANDVAVDVSSDGLLNAWIDFNRDGDWKDQGEQIFTNRALTSGRQPYRSSFQMQPMVGETLLVSVLAARRICRQPVWRKTGR